MTEDEYIRQLEDLSGKVAIVTGGAAGIGLETTKYLAQKGCKVYVAARSSQKTSNGINSIQESLGEKGSLVLHHELDLGSVTLSKQSALEFKKLEGRLDIVMANAGISMASLAELSPDGFERMFAVNHLGHFAFITSLTDLLQTTAASTGEARVVVTSSLGHKMSKGFDEKALTTTIPGDGKSLTQIPAAFTRYGFSKLANIWFTQELDRRIQAQGINNIYVNCCHPGIAGATGLGSGGFEAGSKWLEPIVRRMLTPFNTNIDAAKTQTYLAASKEVVEKNVHAEYWVPNWTWRWKYINCGEEKLGAVAKNTVEQKKLWELSERIVQKGGT